MICPGCKQDVEPKPLGFTWWGGALGPRLLAHVECPQCRARFNGRTGQPNTTGIVVYSVVIGALTLLVMYLLFVRM